jgi:hypothetical protein
MSVIPHWTETFYLEGQGDGYGYVECYPSPARGQLNTIPSIRGTGLVTQIDSIWFVRDVDASLVNGTPVDDYVIAEGQTITITASATDSSTSTAIDNAPFFARGLGIIVDVTASGAWELFVTIEFFDLTAPGVS